MSLPNRTEPVKKKHLDGDDINWSLHLRCSYGLLLLMLGMFFTPWYKRHDGDLFPQWILMDNKTIFHQILMLVLKISMNN